MTLSQTVRTGGWILIGLNLLMAFGSIRVFIRMAPAIEMIIDRNERSLEACEEMLASLALAVNGETDVEPLKKSFADALDRARSNITEEEEPHAIASIGREYPDAFNGDRVARERTVASVVRLGGINREAMIIADGKARRVGNGGAWGVVFMASSLFLAGMLFMRTLKRVVIKPFQEIHASVSAFRGGDAMRRCMGTGLPDDITTVYRDLNDLLDRLSLPADDGGRGRSDG